VEYRLAEREAAKEPVVRVAAVHERVGGAALRVVVVMGRRMLRAGGCGGRRGAHVRRAGALACARSCLCCCHRRRRLLGVGITRRHIDLILRGGAGLCWTGDVRRVVYRAVETGDLGGLELGRSVARRGGAGVRCARLGRSRVYICWDREGCVCLPWTLDAFCFLCEFAGSIAAARAIPFMRHSFQFTFLGRQREWLLPRVQ
jgi:hypothetical protein